MQQSKKKILSLMVIGFLIGAGFIPTFLIEIVQANDFYKNH